MARKIVLSLTLALFAAFLTIPASATCGDEGLHTHGGGTVQTVGTRATLTQAGVTNCNLWITHIIAGLVQTGTTAGSTTLAIWNNTDCSSNFFNSYAQLGVTATTGYSTTWEFKADSNGPILATAIAGDDVCVAFSTGGLSGVIESIYWEGFWSANAQ